VWGGVGKWVDGCVSVWVGVFLLFYLQRTPLHSNTTCFGFLILKHINVKMSNFNPNN